MMQRLPGRSFWRRFCAARERSGFQSGWALIGWGLAFFLSPPDYLGLSHHGPPLAWAVAPALLGLLQLGVVFGGPPSWQRRTSLLMTGVWGFIEYFLFLSHARVVMVVIIPTFIIANGLSFILAPPTRPSREEPDALPDTLPGAAASPRTASGNRAFSGAKALPDHSALSDSSANPPRRVAGVPGNAYSDTA